MRTIFWRNFSQVSELLTAQKLIASDLRLSTEANKVSVLVFLDLSAAFDTFDHEILINHLKSWASLSECVLNRFQTYFIGRQFFISLGEHVSEKYDI